MATVTPPAIVPKAVLCCALITPAFIATAPVNVLAPVKVNVPVPCFVKAPPILMMPSIVTLLPFVSIIAVPAFRKTFRAAGEEILPPACKVAPPFMINVLVALPSPIAADEFAFKIP